MSCHWCFSSLLLCYLSFLLLTFYQAMFRRDLGAGKSTQKARLPQDCHLVVLLSVTARLPLDADTAGSKRQTTWPQVLSGLKKLNLWNLASDPVWQVLNTQVLGESAAIRWKSYLRKQKVLGQLEQAFGFMN